MRYRYITCGTAMPDEPLSDFRLLAQSKMSTSDTAWRVILTDDVKLVKYACDEYSTTEDNRPLSAFQCIPVVRIHKKWRPMPELANVRPCDWYLVLRDKGYIGTVYPRTGYLKKEQYRQFIRESSRAAM